MLRRVPKATWLLVALAAVLGMVGLTMEHMLVRDVMLMASVGVLLLALILLIKPSRERLHPTAPADAPTDDARGSTSDR